MDEYNAREVLYSALFAAATVARYDELRPGFQARGRGAFPPIAASSLYLPASLRTAAAAQPGVFSRLRDASARLCGALASPPQLGRLRDHAVGTVLVRNSPTEAAEAAPRDALDERAAAAAAGFACDFCGGRGAGGGDGRRLPKCGRCKVARFCDAACAAAGWLTHRKVCAERSMP